MDTYTFCTTSLEEGSAYPASPASERPQAYVVYCAAAGIGYAEICNNIVRPNITIFAHSLVSGCVQNYAYMDNGKQRNEFRISTFRT
jgi:hypothetical protein